MRVVCLMPIHGRLPITIETVQLLKRQTKPFYHIVLIGSDLDDEQILMHIDPDVDYVHYPNNPLSAKIQFGLDYVRTLDPDAVLLTGSDSWLCPKWNAVMSRMIANGFHVVGQSCLHVCYIAPHEAPKVLLSSYKTRPDPIGAGRVISRYALDALDWQLYPPGMNKGLDWASYQRLKTVVPETHITTIQECTFPEIFEIKSPLWDTITSFEQISCSSRIARIPMGFSELCRTFPHAQKIIKRLVPEVVLS